MGLQTGAVTRAPGPKSKAVVIWYSREKSHGFLAVDGYPDDLYVHANEVRMSGIPAAHLLKGTHLLCNVGLYKGRPVAVDLELTDPPEA